jgi:hypothetical protein
MEDSGGRAGLTGERKQRSSPAEGTKGMGWGKKIGIGAATPLRETLGRHGGVVKPFFPTV